MERYADCERGMINYNIEKQMNGLYFAVITAAISEVMEMAAMGTHHN